MPVLSFNYNFTEYKSTQQLEKEMTKTYNIKFKIQNSYDRIYEKKIMRWRRGRVYD